MTHRLDEYNAGETPKLRFYSNGSGRSSSYVEDHHTIVSKSGKGEARTITFRDFKNGFEWEAYRYRGRWAYGSSAARLGVED